MSEIIFKTIVGSHLFGTNTPNSDTDIKGVFVPSAESIIVPNLHTNHMSFNTGDSKSKNTSSDTDEEYFAVHKFLDMLYRGDMIATEIMFANQMLEDNADWNYIKSFKHKLISSKCKGFVGYVQRQASVYGVKGDRLNEINQTINYLEKEINSLINLNEKLENIPNIEDMFVKFSEGKKHSKITFIESQGRNIFHFECCDRKIPMTVTLQEAIRMYRRVSDEYGNRARAASTANGIDWKAVSHAVRVGKEAIDLLSLGEIIFPLPYADYLLDIKMGNVEYSKIERQMEELLSKVETLSNECKILPKEVDVKLINKIVYDLYSARIK